LLSLGSENAVKIGLHNSRTLLIPSDGYCGTIFRIILRLFHVDMVLTPWVSLTSTTVRLQVAKLYERCLIACANYPEYWIRYVQRLEQDDVTGATEALSRATDIFVKVSLFVREAEAFYPCSKY
jgi:hypothetical protein